MKCGRISIVFPEKTKSTIFDRLFASGWRHLWKTSMKKPAYESGQS